MKQVVVPFITSIVVVCISSCAGSGGAGGGGGGQTDTVVVHDTVCPDPDFKVAYLDDGSVKTLVEETGAWGMRVYNGRRDDTDAEGTIVAVGIDKEKGKEVDIPNTDQDYRIFEKLLGTDSQDRDAGHTEAKKAVDWVADDHQPNYCTEFSKEDLARLLGTSDANAIRFRPMRMWHGGRWLPTIVADAVKVEGGEAHDLPDSPRIVDTEPCPATCGPMEYYLRTM